VIHGCRRVYEGRVLNLRVEEVGKPSGGTRFVEVVEHTGGVVIVAQPEPGTIALVRQYRFAVEQTLWEAPAGMIDAGEVPADAALRELREETGYRAERVEFLFTAYSTPGFCQERLHFFVARGLEPGAQALDDAEDIQCRIWTLDEAWRAVLSDELRDAKTQIALMWARQAESS
jgi:ADP-ribose pyrophosphatase